MPGLTAINNTYTANTPSGVRECLYFLQRQGRSGSQREATDRFRDHPISIVYGYGVSDAGLFTAGDDLDIVPTQWDRVRKRRWWDVSNTASGQTLLPFPEYNRVHVTRIARYSGATEIVVQFGQGGHTQLNLTAPRNQAAAPGPYTVRAIRIHNVDGSETVPPVRPYDDEIAQVAHSAGDAVVPGRTRAGSSPYAQMADNEREADGLERCRPEPPPIGPEWRTTAPTAEPASGYDEATTARRPVRGWRAEVRASAPLWEPPDMAQARARTRRVPPTVPIREIVTRADVDRQTREYHTRQLGTDEVRQMRDIESRDDLERLRAGEARMVRDMDMDMDMSRFSAYAALAVAQLGRAGNNDT